MLIEGYNRQNFVNLKTDILDVYFENNHQLYIKHAEEENMN